MKKLFPAVLFMLLISSLVSAGSIYDLDVDGQVDIFDILLLAESYGSFEGAANYFVERDFNNDSRINIVDLIFVASAYGDYSDGVISLNPLQRSFSLNFNSGIHTNTEAVNGELVLADDGTGNYYSQGTWESPIYDTQNQYVMWDWVYANVDFNGLQENLLPNGDFEEILCTDTTTGYPRPCQVNFPPVRSVPPFVDNTVSSSGDNSIRIEFNDSYETAYYYTQQNYNDKIPLDYTKKLHILFDMKMETQGNPIEFWLRIYNSTGNAHNGVIMRYTHPMEDFEEQYFEIDLAKLVDNEADIQSFIYQFFQYYRNSSTPNTVWVDNFRIFQDSPVSYQVRTSADGETWTDWLDERYFVPERTAPGGQVDRYIQFRINMNTDDVAKSPRINSLKLDYSKAFEFPISWDYMGPAVFDQVIEPVSSKGAVSKTPDGNLEFADGTPAKFWSVQLATDAEDILGVENMDSMCKKLRQMGFNMIKATPPLGAYSTFRTMLRECADEGIYVYYQYGGKTLSPLFNPEAYASGAINHLNNVVDGNSLIDDPQITFFQLLNEVSLHSEWRRNNTLLYTSPSIVNYLNPFWENYLLEKYPTYQDLVNAWDDGTGIPFYNFENGDDYPSNIIRAFFSLDWNDMSNTRFSDTDEFYAKVHEYFYEYYTDYLHDNGYDGLVVPNNHYYGISDLAARRASDITDQHSYYPYHRYPTDGGEIISTEPLVEDPYHNIMSYITLDAIEGYPMTVSESNIRNPNMYGHEMPLFISGYMSFLDYDQWTWFIIHGFDYTNPSIQKVPRNYFSYYDTSKMALMPAASRIYTEGYVKPGTKVVKLSHSSQTTNNYQHNRNNHQWNIPDIDTDFFLEYRIERSEFNATRDKTAQEYFTEYGITKPENPYVNEHGELVMDSELGYFTINTPKAQGFTGKTQAGIIDLMDVDIQIPPKGNNFSAIVLINLDGQDIIDSNHLFLTATGRIENSGVTWKPDRRGFSPPGWTAAASRNGREPVLVEGITATIHLTNNNNGLTIYKMDSNGMRTAETIPNEQEENVYTFTISDMDETLWYELVFS